MNNILISDNRKKGMNTKLISDSRNEDEIMNTKPINNQKEDEYTENLQRLLQEHTQLRNFRYFLNQALRWYQKRKAGRPDSRIVILGTGIPEELVMAVRKWPFYLLGGSHRAGGHMGPSGRRHEYGRTFPL